MGPSEKIAYVRRELSLGDEIVACNAGAWGPFCRAAREAIARGFDDELRSRGGDPAAMRDGYTGLARYEHPIEDAKAEVAKLLNCAPDEVALGESSTMAMNHFLWGFDFAPGDEIIAGSLENTAANVPLWVVTERRKLKLRIADLGYGEKDAVAAIAEQITPKTRVILISDVSFATGARVDLKGISDLAHRHGILVLADGIQAVGTHPVDVKALGVDAYAIARHKFLCGPDGAGALYIDKSAIDRIQPTYTGVFSDLSAGKAGYLRLRGTAQRYEVSTRPLPIIMGGTAAVRWLANDVGWDFVFSRTRENYAKLYGYMTGIPGVQVLSGPKQAGLLTFAIEGLEPVDIVAALQKRMIFTRTIIITKPQGVRLSVGVWNRDSDMETIAGVVNDIARTVRTGSHA